MPIAHVEESWQTAEFYCNKVISLTLCIRTPMDSHTTNEKQKKTEKWARNDANFGAPSSFNMYRVHIGLPPMFLLELNDYVVMIKYTFDIKKVCMCASTI